ncbi:MAG TPA: c-type cytochrome [Thermoanaerobaculia bacterium]|nr:c-type cytochrome [Thermoanaerobaculia bacterium]
MRKGAAGLLLLATVALLAVRCGENRLPEGDARGGDLRAGRRVYLDKCARCHSPKGDGKTVVAGRFPYANLIDGVWRTDGSAATIEKQIRHGRDPMPAFEKKLTDGQIRQTVSYVHELTGGE